MWFDENRVWAVIFRTNSRLCESIHVEKVFFSSKLFNAVCVHCHTPDLSLKTKKSCDMKRNVQKEVTSYQDLHVRNVFNKGFSDLAKRWISLQRLAQKNELELRIRSKIIVDNEAGRTNKAKKSAKTNKRKKPKNQSPQRTNKQNIFREKELRNWIQQNYKKLLNSSGNCYQE